MTTRSLTVATLGKPYVRPHMPGHMRMTSPIPFVRPKVKP